MEALLVERLRAHLFRSRPLHVSPMFCVDAIDGGTRHNKKWRGAKGGPVREREIFIDNLLVRVHRCFGCTGLAPWEVESPFPGSRLWGRQVKKNLY